jgi:thiol-disulfide isomerase/thioredoxin
VDNAELRQAKSRIGIEPCPAPAAGESSDLPSVTLPCLGGGRAVELSTLGGPTLVSLWASWCTTCPDELPLFQRLAEEHGDRVRVLGVDYQDTQPGAALLLLRDTGATYPQLADPGGDLAEHYRLTGLPALLLVDGEGRVTFLKTVVDSYAELLTLVEDHTGVRVRAG